MKSYYRRLPLRKQRPLIGVFKGLASEEGNVANDYNILEDGSFELTIDAAPYKWTKPSVTVETADTTPTRDGSN